MRIFQRLEEAHAFLGIDCNLPTYLVECFLCRFNVCFTGGLKSVEDHQCLIPSALSNKPSRRLGNTGSGDEKQERSDGFRGKVTKLSTAR